MDYIKAMSTWSGRIAGRRRPCKTAVADVTLAVNCSRERKQGLKAIPMAPGGEDRIGSDPSESKRGRQVGTDSRTK